LFQATVVIPGVVINRAVWLTTRIIDNLGKQFLLPLAVIWNELEAMLQAELLVPMLLIENFGSYAAKAYC
jgi:hypothetical protein